ncbi:MarR family transcriptional regulator [Sphingomonas sp. RB56-2]|uniref:MarR family transcriptional regulator n=1 Tax=Sphingomonas brevis TaxID=2908206 RepID=A0ABT0S9Y6_9SPHN|nr:MarR family transcriptional regulator [Sphingomonas brevis]MCL6741147.1 MarR family transcriptional regulator [Sphingomonas brevis]
MARPLTLDEHLCFSLYGASIAVNRIYKPVLDRLGLTYPQYLVLTALSEEDGQTVSGIADRLALESSTVTPLVKRLEAAKLVTRTRNPRDERQVNVALTDKGKKLRIDAQCLTNELLKSGLKPPQLIALNKQVADLRDRLAKAL